MLSAAMMKFLCVILPLFTLLSSAQAEEKGNPAHAAVVWAPLHGGYSPYGIAEGIAFDANRNLLKRIYCGERGGFCSSAEQSLFAVPEENYFLVPENAFEGPSPRDGLIRIQFSAVLDQALEKIKDADDPVLFISMDSHGTENSFVTGCDYDPAVGNIPKLQIKYGDAFKKFATSLLPRESLRKKLRIQIIIGACYSEASIEQISKVFEIEAQGTSGVLFRNQSGKFYSTRIDIIASAKKNEISMNHFFYQLLEHFGEQHRERTKIPDGQICLDDNDLSQICVASRMYFSGATLWSSYRQLESPLKGLSQLDKNELIDRWKSDLPHSTLIRINDWLGLEHLAYAFVPGPIGEPIRRQFLMSTEDRLSLGLAENGDQREQVRLLKFIISENPKERRMGWYVASQLHRVNPQLVLDQILEFALIQKREQKFLLKDVIEAMFFLDQMTGADPKQELSFDPKWAEVVSWIFSFKSLTDDSFQLLYRVLARVPGLEARRVFVNQAIRFEKDVPRAASLSRLSQNVFSKDFPIRFYLRERGSGVMRELWRDYQETGRNVFLNLMRARLKLGSEGDYRDALELLYETGPNDQINLLQGLTYGGAPEKMLRKAELSPVIGFWVKLDQDFCALVRDPSEKNIDAALELMNDSLLVSHPAGSIAEVGRIIVLFKCFIRPTLHSDSLARFIDLIHTRIQSTHIASNESFFLALSSLYVSDEKLANQAVMSLWYNAGREVQDVDIDRRLRVLFPILFSNRPLLIRNNALAVLLQLVNEVRRVRKNLGSGMSDFSKMISNEPMYERSFQSALQMSPEERERHREIWEDNSSELDRVGNPMVFLPDDLLLATQKEIGSRQNTAPTAPGESGTGPDILLESR